MATFGRARRAPGSGNSFLRPFAGLFVLSLALLLLRDTTFVRAGATFVTELLVPAERVLLNPCKVFGPGGQSTE